MWHINSVIICKNHQKSVSKLLSRIKVMSKTHSGTPGYIKQT